MIPFGIVILAAGASSRMGQPKMLLPWGQTTIIGHLIDRWRQLGAAQIGLVCSADQDALQNELDRIGFPAECKIVNSAPALGMFSSVQCAARWTGWQSTIRHWAVVLGDQPHLSFETLRLLIDYSARHPGNICQPSRHGRPRHPVVLPRIIFEKIASSSHATLKEFLGANLALVQLIELDDAGLDFDIDTQAEYKEARRRFSAVP